MQPGERVTLIKKIAGRLEGDRPQEIRLTLSQFGTRPSLLRLTTDPFVGVIEAIEDADDSTLVALHGHLFGDSTPAASPRSRLASVATEIWPQDVLRLFISHTHAYKAEMAQLQDSLRSFGVYGFVAHTDIHPTLQWQDIIESALETCDALAAYMSDDFHASFWADQEVGFCVGRAVLIIPIKAGRDPYGFIGKYQALQGLGKASATIAQEIADILVEHPLTASRMVTPTAVTFSQSQSFDRARENLKRLQKIPSAAWTPELIDLVDKALDENSQLREGIAQTESGPKPIPEIVRAAFGALEIA